MTDPIRAAREAACEIARRNKVTLEDVEWHGEEDIRVVFCCGYSRAECYASAWAREIADAVPWIAVRVTLVTSSVTAEHRVEPPPPPTLAWLAREWKEKQDPNTSIALRREIDAVFRCLSQGNLHDWSDLILRVDEEARR